MTPTTPLRIGIPSIAPRLVSAYADDLRVRKLLEPVVEAGFLEPNVMVGNLRPGRVVRLRTTEESTLGSLERTCGMAYDAELADRVRGALSAEKNVREVKMFGGLAFMVNDQMVACVSGGGGALLVRVARDRDAEYLDVNGARRAEMGKGRSMGEGWITIDEEALVEDKDLHFWIDAVLEYNAQKTRER